MTHSRNAAMSISHEEGGARRRRLWRIAILAAGLAALASAALSLGQSGPGLLAQTALPTQVAGLSAEAWSGKVTLTWTKPAAGEAVTDYQICWSASAISTTCGTGGTRGADGQWSLDIDASTGVTAGETSVSYDWFTPDGISTTAATNFAVRAKNGFGTRYGPISAIASATAIEETTPAFLMPAVGAQTFLEGATATIDAPRVRGGDAPLTYSLAVTGPNPAVTAVTPSTIGLSIDSATGRVAIANLGASLSLTADATYSATVTVTDGDGDTDTEAFDVTIENNTMPAFGGTTIAAQSFTESAAITPLNVPTASGGVTGGNAPLTYSVSANLPTGLSIDPSTGIISGTPARRHRRHEPRNRHRHRHGQRRPKQFDLVHHHHRQRGGSRRGRPRNRAPRQHLLPRRRVRVRATRVDRRDRNPHLHGDGFAERGFEFVHRRRLLLPQHRRSAHGHVRQHHLR